MESMPITNRRGQVSEISNRNQVNKDGNNEHPQTVNCFFIDFIVTCRIFSITRSTPQLLTH